MFAQKAPPPRGWDLHRDNRRMPLQLENEALLELTVAIAGRPVAYELSQDTVTFRTKGAAVEARRACRECPLRGCTGHFEEGQTDAGGGRQPEGPGLPTPSVPRPARPSRPLSAQGSIQTLRSQGARRRGSTPPGLCLSVCPRRDSGNGGPRGFQQGEVTGSAGSAAGPPAQGMYFLGAGSSGTSGATWEPVPEGPS